MGFLGNGGIFDQLGPLSEPAFGQIGPFTRVRSAYYFKWIDLLLIVAGILFAIFAGPLGLLVGILMVALGLASYGGF